MDRRIERAERSKAALKNAFLELVVTKDPEEITVVDNDECVIKINGIEYDDFWGYVVKVYFENKSEDKTFMFTAQEASVNGMDWPVLCIEEVAPGKKANEDMNFLDDDLNELIPVFTDIEVTFRVYDSNDWSADDVVLETVHLYPFGEENASVFVREPQSTDIVLVDNDDITVIATSCEEDSIWGYVVKIYIINKTDLTLMFSADEVSVNGFMCDPYWGKSLSPGKTAFSNMTWSSSDFEDNGITEVEEIEMLLRVYDYDNWLSDDIYNETVTINP